MRPAFLHAARMLQRGREAALVGEDRAAVSEYLDALELLCTLPPERTRDVLLSHAHLAYYQTVTLHGHTTQQQADAQRHLHLGVSYARSTRDPLARAIAEECLGGIEAAL